MSVAELAGLVNRLELVTNRLEKLADQQSQPSSEDMSAQVAPFVALYDQILANSLTPFLQLSAQIGGEVKTQVDLMSSTLRAQREFLVVASKSQQPNQEALLKLLQPTSQGIQAVQEFRQKNRVSPFFNHLSAISESIPALGWVAVAPTPAPYIKEMIDAGQFYTNRVLVEYKEKDKNHINWVRALLQLLQDLYDYVKQNHTTGLVWNPKGVVASAPAAGGPPPPPPPPPAGFFDEGGSSGQQDARAALFKEINQGEGIGRALRKVTADQQTHKTPGLRQQGATPYQAPSATSAFKSFKSPVGPPTKPPRLELEGKKWRVEYQVGNKDLILNETEMNQSVNVFQCHDSLIQVKGKVNSIILDSCKKTSIVFNNIVSCVEFINCQSMQAQSMGKVPTINIDKTDGVQIYLSKDSLDCEIVSSKSSEMNVSIPQANGDYIEVPVPEQFKTTVVGKTLKTVPVDTA